MNLHFEVDLSHCDDYDDAVIGLLDWVQPHGLRTRTKGLTMLASSVTNVEYWVDNTCNINHLPSQTRKLVNKAIVLKREMVLNQINI